MRDARSASSDNIVSSDFVYRGGVGESYPIAAAQQCHIQCTQPGSAIGVMLFPYEPRQKEVLDGEVLAEVELVKPW